MFQTHCREVRPMTVVGFFPSGDGFEDTVHAKTAYEAKIRALAVQRYSEDGGDIGIVCVMDSSGNLLDEEPSSADIDLMTDHDAVENVLCQAAQVLPADDYTHEGATQSNSALLGAYVEFFQHVLNVASQVFENLACHGAGGPDLADEMIVEFESASGVVFDILPSKALAAVADLALSRDITAAGLQVKEMASVAGYGIDLACLDAFSDY